MREHAARYENDAEDLFRYRVELHVAENAKATAERAKRFTPVPLGRDLCRFSSQLLFSDPPALTTEEADQERLDEWAEFVGLGDLLSDAGAHVAAAGSGALRVVRDDRVGPLPLLTFEDASRVIWATHHGRYVVGGVLVVEVAGEEDESSVRYRLLEHHGPGFVHRKLFKGDVGRLGTNVPLDSRPEFASLRDEERTGLKRPTLIKWSNTAGDDSDLEGLGPLLDALDEAESVGREKLRASKPLTFVHRRLVDGQGEVDLDAAILVDGTNPAEQSERLAEVVQGKMEASDHAAYVSHLRELAVSHAGYSLASWGVGEGGRADSGRALKLRQARSLLTASGKRKMATKAIAEAAGIALAMSSGRSDIPTVDVVLGDGLPVDRFEQAQELKTLRDAGLISEEAAIRELHPQWDEEQLRAEILALTEANNPASPLDRSLNMLRETRQNREAS